MPGAVGQSPPVQHPVALHCKVWYQWSHVRPGHAIAPLPSPALYFFALGFTLGWIALHFRCRTGLPLIYITLHESGLHQNCQQISHGIIYVFPTLSPWEQPSTENTSLSHITSTQKVQSCDFGGHFGNPGNSLLGCMILIARKISNCRENIRCSQGFLSLEIIQAGTMERKHQCM